MGSLSDLELQIRVLFVLRCWCLSAGIATRPFVILESRERRFSRLLLASGFRPSWGTILVALLIGL